MSTTFVSPSSVCVPVEGSTKDVLLGAYIVVQFAVEAELLAPSHVLTAQNRQAVEKNGIIIVVANRNSTVSPIAPATILFTKLAIFDHQRV